MSRSKPGKSLFYSRFKISEEQGAFYFYTFASLTRYQSTVTDWEIGKPDADFEFAKLQPVKAMGANRTCGTGLGE